MRGRVFALAAVAHPRRADRCRWPRCRSSSRRSADATCRSSVSHATVDGTRIVLIAGGLFALAAGCSPIARWTTVRQMSVWTDLTHLDARRLVRAAPDAQWQRVRRLRGRRGCRQVDADRAARRVTARRGRAVTVTHEPGATPIGGADPRAAAARQRADHPARRGVAVRRRSRAPRRHRHPTCTRSRRGRAHRPLHRLVAGLSGRRTATRVDDVSACRAGPPADCAPTSPCCWTCQRRTGSRARAHAAMPTSSSPSRSQFHEQVRAAFRALAEAEPRRYLVVDATCRRIRSRRRCSRASSRCSPRAAVRCGTASTRPEMRTATPIPRRLRHDRVWGELVGQDDTVTDPSRALPQAAAAMTQDDADPEAAAAGGMTHAWLFTGPPGSGRSVAARAFAAALQCERDDVGCGECAGCRAVRGGVHPDVHSVVPEGLSISVCRDARGRRHRGSPPSARPMAGRRDRGRRPAHRAGGQRAAQGGRGTTGAHGIPALRAVDASGRRLGDPALAMPVGDAAHAARPPRWRRCCTQSGLDDATAQWAAAAGQGHIGRSRRLVRDDDARARRAEVLAIPASLQSMQACLDAADHARRSRRGRGSGTVGRISTTTRPTALQTALGAGGTGKGAATAARGMSGALKDLERRQKSRATRAQRDALDRALVDLAAFYRDVLLVHAGSAVASAHPDFDDDVRAVAAAGVAGRSVCSGWTPCWPAARHWSSTSNRGSRSRR